MDTKATNALRLYKFEGETFCKMTDVLRMIHHEASETNDGTVLNVLSRMKFRLIRNDLFSTSVGSRNDNTRIPGRYAVARPQGIGYSFYAGQDGSRLLQTDDLLQAKLYVTFRDASAAADFLSGTDWCVLDVFDSMSEGDRFRRALYAPYDADEGNKQAVRANPVT